MSAFKLAPLQRYREHQRDLCRQLLAQAIADDATLRAQQDELTASREQLLAEIAAMQQQQRLNVGEAAARRYHAARLQGQVQAITIQREDVARRIQLCRQTLVKADQGVKVLEKLEEQARTAAEQLREHKESREREEAWQAGKTARSGHLG